MLMLAGMLMVFVPFLGDFFSIDVIQFWFAVFFLVVFVPFLGDFFSIREAGR